MVLLVMGLVMVALAISLPMSRAMIDVGHRTGQIDRADPALPHKREVRPIPSTGGIAIVTAIALPMLLGILAIWMIAPDHWTGRLELLGEHVDGLRAMTPLGLALLAAILAMHILGLIDDRKALGPWSKLIFQIVIALALIAADIRVFQMLDAYGPAGTVASAMITLAWMIVIINAMNFLDNMDGLSAGVAVVIAGVYLAATLLAGQWFVAALCALLVGSLLGFLVYNVHPARLYMGDSGSLVIGLMLAVISIRTTYFVGPDEAQSLTVGASGRAHAVLMPLMVLAIPLYDCVSVTLLRLRQGQSPLVGDRQHLSHRLLRRGLSVRTAVGILWLCTLATALGGVIFPRLEPWQAIIVALQTLAIVLALALLELTAPYRDP